MTLEQTLKLDAITLAIYFDSLRTPDDEQSYQDKIWWLEEQEEIRDWERERI